jgi:hypothetical protein
MKVMLHCTDKGVDVEADVLTIKKQKFLEVAINTVKVKLSYTNKKYVGSMAGLEFVIREENIPEEYVYKGYTR